jgi:hypothetical protein
VAKRLAETGHFKGRSAKPHKGLSDYENTRLLCCLDLPRFCPDKLSGEQAARLFGGSGGLCFTYEKHSTTAFIGSLEYFHCKVESLLEHLAYEAPYSEFYEPNRTSSVLWLVIRRLVDLPS